MNDADLTQGSKEWFEARWGSLGGSGIKDAITPLVRGGETKASQDLSWELAAERLTKRQKLKREARGGGIETEQEGRLKYSIEFSNEKVVQVGIIRHPNIPYAHVSPDALVGDDGGLEIKCPTSGVHLKTLVEG